MNGHLLSDLSWVIQQMLANRISQSQLSLLSELRNRNSRKHLVHRSKIKFGVDLVRNMVALVCHARGLLKQDPLLLCHQDGTGELIYFDKLIECLLKFLESVHLIHDIHLPFNYPRSIFYRYGYFQ